jgi:hypothetical protein
LQREVERTVEWLYQDKPDGQMDCLVEDYFGQMKNLGQIKEPYFVRNIKVGASPIAAVVRELKVSATSSTGSLHCLG